MTIKFQSGGIAPLVSYEPVTVTGGAAATTSEESSSGSDLTDKDLLELLKDLNGLPSDIATITNSLQNFYIDQQYNPYHSTSNIASRYASIIAQVKTAKFNHEQYKEAQDQVIKNGGINEYAIDEHGRLYCMNSEGNVKLLRAEQLKDNSEYQPLTNSELLHYRAHNIPFKNEMLTIVKNGIGMKTVTNMIQEVIGSIGTTSTSKESYAKTKATSILRGIEDFKKAVQESDGSYNPTVENLYKTKLLTKSQAEQAQYAFDYVWNTLPENAKTLLKIKGGTGEEKGAKMLIMKLIGSTLSDEFSFDFDLKESPTSNSSKDGSKGGNGFEMDPVQLLMNGYGQDQKITIQTGAGGSYGIDVNTVRMPIVNKEGKSIGASATLDDITTSGFSGYLDFENASMGGTMIPTVGFNNIAINGTALYTAYLPVDIKEYNNTGNIKPDIAMLGRYKQAQDVIAQQNITDPEQINAIYQEYQLPIMYGSDGDILTNYIQFGIVNATALESAFNEDVSFDDYLSETTDENIITNTLSIINSGKDSKDKIEHDSKSFWDSIFGTDYDHVYKGTVFIPVNTDYFTATAGFGKHLSPIEAQTIEAKQQAAQRQKIASDTYVNPGRL